MVVSPAKLEANRRNAQKSTGPRTEEGKERAKFNALTHGMRAESLVLPDEDERVLEDRKAAWTASLLPRDDVEQRAVDDAVIYSWLQDRARRAQAARLTVNLVNHGLDQAQAAEEAVLDLGRRLFTDRLGPLTFYPTACPYKEMDPSRRPSTSLASPGDDPDQPAMLVLRLQSTLCGCEWLLREWAGLKLILDSGQPWLSSDKLKAVRLLGRQPFDAIDDRDVALVFLASFVLKGDKGRWYWEIATEMNENDTNRFRQNAAARALESLTPEDATKAREALLGIIERATERLTSKAEAHRERARIEAARARDLLGFDESPAGESLRRHELATGRAMARSLDSLRKHRREVERNVSSPSPVVRCPLPVISCTVESIEEPNATNEPTDAWENATNEPTDAWENATNEPTDAWENATNEPTDAWEKATNEPSDEWENATNEPSDARENPTNQPTVGLENTTNQPKQGEKKQEFGSRRNRMEGSRDNGARQVTGETAPPESKSDARADPGGKTTVKAFQPNLTPTAAPLV